MADAKEQLAHEGFSDRDADAVIRRALEIQQRVQASGDRLNRSDLEAGAEAVGVSREFIQQAIQEMKAERQREADRRAARQRTRRTAGIVLALCLALTMLFSHRALNVRHAEVEAMQAQWENVLQRRHDLLPNLISVAKASAAHEQQLAASIGELRRRAAEAMSFAEKQALEQDLDGIVRQLMAALRANPAASSTVMFVRLSDEMAGAENRISLERKRYNEAASRYNHTARSFPIFLVRPVLGFPKAHPLFQASEGARDAPVF